MPPSMPARKSRGRMLKLVRHTLGVAGREVRHLRIFLQFLLRGAIAQAGLMDAVKVVLEGCLMPDRTKITKHALEGEVGVAPQQLGCCRCRVRLPPQLRV